MIVGQKTVVSLVMGDTHLVAARFASGRKWPPKCLAVEPVALEQDGYRGALNSLIAKGILRHADLNVVVPRHRVTTRVVKLPSTNIAEIRRMVQLDAGSYVPYPVDELVFSQAILNTDADGYSTVLVVLVRREEIDEILEPLRQARLNPRSVTISSLALYNAYLAAGARDENEHMAAVHIGASGLDVVVAHHGELTFMRGVPWSGGWRADGPPLDQPALDTVVRELRTSIEASERETARRTPLTKMYLSGDISALEQIRDRIKHDLELDVGILDLADTGFTTPVAVLAGATVSPRTLPTAVSIDLLPADYIAAREKVIHRRYLAACGVLVVASVLLTTQISRQRVQAKLEYIKYLDGEIARVEPTARLVRKKQSRVKAVRAQRERGFSALDFMAAIHRLAPQDMVLRRVEFEHGTGAILKARARDRSIAFEYVNLLRQSGEPYLEKAEVGTTGVSFERGENVIDFDVLIPFANDETELAEQMEEFGEDALTSFEE